MFRDRFNIFSGCIMHIVNEQLHAPVEISGTNVCFARIGCIVYKILVPGCLLSSLTEEKLYRLPGKS